MYALNNDLSYNQLSSRYWNCRSFIDTPRDINVIIIDVLLTEDKTLIRSHTIDIT